MHPFTITLYYGMTKEAYLLTCDPGNDPTQDRCHVLRPLRDGGAPVDANTDPLRRLPPSNTARTSMLPRISQAAYLGALAYRGTAAAAGPPRPRGML